MALVTQIQTQYGITIPSAYAKIDCFNGNKTTIEFTVLFFINEDARYSKKDAIKTATYAIPFNKESLENTLSQCYNYLKTLPDFSNAIDC